MHSFNPALKYGIESTDWYLPYFSTKISTDPTTHVLFIYTLLKIFSMAKEMKCNSIKIVKFRMDWPYVISDRQGQKLESHWGVHRSFSQEIKYTISPLLNNLLFGSFSTSFISTANPTILSEDNICRLAVINNRQLQSHRHCCCNVLVIC
jgi:hypothetical protein